LQQDGQLAQHVPLLQQLLAQQSLPQQLGHLAQHASPVQQDALAVAGADDMPRLPRAAIPATNTLKIRVFIGCLSRYGTRVHALWA